MPNASTEVIGSCFCGVTSDLRCEAGARTPVRHRRSVVTPEKPDRRNRTAETGPPKVTRPTPCPHPLVLIELGTPKQ